MDPQSNPGLQNRRHTPSRGMQMSACLYSFISHSFLSYILFFIVLNYLRWFLDLHLLHFSLAKKKRFIRNCPLGLRPSAVLSGITCPDLLLAAWMLLLLVPTGFVRTYLPHRDLCCNHLILFASLEDHYQVLYLHIPRLYHSLLFPQCL